MFGPFRATSVSFGGLLWKSPWRMSPTRKANQRKRMKAVDEVIAAVQESGVACKALDRALLLPTEAEMSPKDKYTTFNPTSPGYRKSVHRVPKFTKLTLRENPTGF
ncbi:hypothetical protein QFC21_001878 [Naganishia friedmannii]|uniref:Uncharacterized protein n=1 Tax=Naganishia friedmannii TaxID=89922 RepID=A0ACC2W332_9TREE|nr:hypothetical protein QFC21_001878 [Naganishia friedmannii]